jgi:hypothetical protein
MTSAAPDAALEHSGEVVTPTPAPGTDHVCLRQADRRLRPHLIGGAVLMLEPPWNLAGARPAC